MSKLKEMIIRKFTMEGRVLVLERHVRRMSGINTNNGSQKVRKDLRSLMVKEKKNSLGHANDFNLSK